MPPITTDRLKALLAEYVRGTGRPVDLLLVGGLALQAYGATERVTQDVDGELVGDLEPLVEFFRGHGIPADLGENISGRSIVAMPPGYRDRASVLVKQPGLCIRLLDPVDFVIAKLRRGTDLDLADAEYVARRFGLAPRGVREAAEAAVGASPRDTVVFLFRKILDLFCARIGAHPE